MTGQKEQPKYKGSGTRLREKMFGEGSGVEITEISQEYAQRLRKDETSFEAMLSKSILSVQRPQKQFESSLSYEQSKIMAWNIMKEILAQKNETFKADRYNRALLPELVKYFIGDNSCQLDLQKGVLIVGAVGVGKDFFMRSMKVLVDKANIKARQFKIIGEKRVKEQIIKANEDRASSFVKVIERFCEGDYLFSDLGIEADDFVHLYSNKYSYMESIIDFRYEKYEKGKCITHFTTNLTPAEIEERYGSRTYSRLCQMCNFVALKGESKRDQANLFKFGE
jgi:DNA replication protein DnaC